MDLINGSLVNGKFPDIFKTIVEPIHKGKTLNDVHNYRPISLLTYPKYWRQSLEVK